MGVGNLLLPAWAKWLGLAFGLALIVWLACWLNTHYFINPAVNAETARWQSRWDQRNTADVKAKANFDNEQRRIEQESQENANQIQKNAQQQINRADALRVVADRDSKRLQQGIADAITKLQQQRGEDPGTGTGSKAGGSSSNMLAQLYREIDDTAGNLAAEADRRGQAGRTCEIQYDFVRARR